MDMTDDEQLLERFFQSAREMEVADNGFSDRVMRQVPRSNTQLLSHLWTAFCLVVATVLFVLMRGWEPVVDGLLTLLSTPPTSHNLLMLMVSMGVVGLLATVEIIHRERFCWPFSSNMP